MSNLPTYDESHAGVHPAMRSQSVSTTDAQQHGYFAPSYAAATTADADLPGYSPRRAGRYASEDEYLAALRKWAAAKQYYQPGELSHDGDNGLVGFYGRTTLEEYAARPGPRAHARQAKRLREAERERARRNTVAVVAGPGPQAEEGLAVGADEVGESLDRAVTVDAPAAKDSRRRSSIFDTLFRRKRSP